MSSIHTRPRTALLAVALLATGLTVASHVPGAAQAPSGPQLAWEQSGETPEYHELCINGSCQWLAATPAEGATWRAPLPVLPLGEHHLVVRACGAGRCVAGAPELHVRIVRPNPRTPPVLSSEAK